MAVLYRHIRLDKNEPFYIGIGKNIKRAYSKFQRSKHWKSIVSNTEYEVEIIFYDLSWKEAQEKEKEFIKFYGRKENGGCLINKTNGGDGVCGLVLSEEQIKKRGLAIKSSWTNERKKEYSEKMKGDKNNYYGKKHTEEIRKKMSLNNNPRKHITDEHKKKISFSNKGKKRTIEVRLKLSELKKGKSPWNKGISCKQETKDKIRDTLLKKNKLKNEIHNGGEANKTKVGMEGLG